MRYFVFLVLLVATLGPARAQTAPAAGRVVVEHLDSQLLRGNPGGENPRRRVSVYLPADYDQHPTKRYPVVYYLHGYTWSDSLIFNQDGMKALLDQAIAAGQIRPFILVVPNEHTRFGGSMYANSATNGPWADFTARELVAFVDKKYRTLARPGSRGLAGHSMGGGGTLRLALQYPGTWAAAYALSPAFVAPAAEFMRARPGLAHALAARRAADVAPTDYSSRLVVALARAFSPAPAAQPFGADLPGSLGADSLTRRDAVLRRWVTATPLYQLPNHPAALQQLRGLAFDWGAQDEVHHIPPACRELGQWLGAFGIPYTAAEYEGTHGSRIMGPTGRVYAQVLPFFNKLLDFE